MSGSVKKASLSVYFWTAASLACMLVIYLFSAQPAEQSSQISGSVAHSTVGTVVGWFKPAGQGLSKAFMDIVETVIRKLAHLGVYMVLGFCVMSAVRRIAQQAGPGKRDGVAQRAAERFEAAERDVAVQRDIALQQAEAVQRDKATQRAGRKKWLAFAISLIWCSLYAASDELHQYFVPGRAGMWQDWLLDTAGALFGIYSVVLFTKRAKTRNKSK